MRPYVLWVIHAGGKGRHRRGSVAARPTSRRHEVDCARLAPPRLVPGQAPPSVRRCQRARAEVPRCARGRDHLSAASARRWPSPGLYAERRLALSGRPAPVGAFGAREPRIRALRRLSQPPARSVNLRRPRVRQSRRCPCEPHALTRCSSECVITVHVRRRARRRRVTCELAREPPGEGSVCLSDGGLQQPRCERPAGHAPRSGRACALPAPGGRHIFSTVPGAGAVAGRAPSAVSAPARCPRAQTLWQTRALKSRNLPSSGSRLSSPFGCRS